MALRTASDLSSLAEAHYAGLLAYARAKARSASVAADIVQESWLRAILAMQKHDILNGRNYLFRTVHNLLIDRQRQDSSRAHRLTREAVVEEIACDRPSPERCAIARQELERIMGIIVKLPPKCQTVFVMRKFDDLTPAEIATQLHLRRGTVEKHLRLALARLLSAVGID